MGKNSYQHKDLIENMPTAFAYHKAIYDENNKPIDYVFLKVNNKFEEITGLKRADVIDKKATDVLDKITNSDFDWIQFYGEIALTGKIINFEKYYEPLGRWYEVKAYSQEKGYFATIFNEITERKKKEKELKKKTNRLNNIFNNTEDIIWSISWPDLQLNFISKAVKDIFGYTVEEIKEDPLLLIKITHSDDKIIQKKAIKKLEEEGYTEREFRVICKDGSIKWIYDKGSMIYDENNNPVRVEGIMRDITKKKTTKSKLKYSQEMYETIFNSTPIGIVIENENGDIIGVNDSECKMTGYTKEELEGSNVIDKFVLPEDQESAKNNIKNVLEGQDIELDIKTPKKNGEIVYMHLKETNITFPDGTKGIISMHLDITDRKRKEEKIKKERRKMENIIEATEAGTFEWNVQTGETIFNEKWAELIGYKLEELSPTSIETWKKFTHPDDLEKCEEILEKHFQGVIDQYKVEIRMEHREGHWIWVLTQGKVISWTDDGEPLKMFGTHLDITERKKRIKALESQHNFQKTLADISSKLIGINNTNLDYEINNCLKKMGRFFEVDRSYIFQFFDDKEYVSNTHEWSAVGVKSEKENLQNLSVDLLPWLMEKLYRKEVVNVFNVEQLCEEAKSEKELFQEENIKSIVIVPIFIKDELWGFFGFDSVKEKKNFNQEKINKLNIITDVITSAFLQCLNINRIEKLTYKDSLTGLYNRRFFEEEMERLDTKRQLPISIIMGDINGLKIINDSYGHKKGDQILVKIAGILKNSIREEDILARWAGDEYIILLPHTKKRKAQEIVSRIKRKNKNIRKEDIPISIGMGVATKSNIEENIKVILEKADDNMYKNKLSESKSASNKIVRNLLHTLGAKSSETVEHAMRMSNLAHNLGERLNLSNSELNRLSLIATLHDIGKTTISEEILTKPDKLTEKEWKIMKEHPEKGYKIASASDDFEIVAEEILAHHEHWNGYGYPNGLKGKEIPYLARIISIIDAYDVMTHERPYSEAISEVEALTEIERCTGEQFDPVLAKEFIEMLKK
ncbi:MAG: PAS domain S-box protein [Halanaerobiales bacterium]